MRAVFQQELRSVQNGLVEISDLVLDAIRDASTAFNTADIALAEHVIAADPRIDRLTVQLDELSIQILGRQGPMARDLRIVVGSLRMSALLERMGDLARHVAQLTRRHYPGHVVPDPLRDVFVEMAAQDIRTAELLNRLLRTQDLQLVQELVAGDARTDELHRAVFAAVLRDDWTGTTEQTVDATLATRFFERFGDQAVSIAKRVQYLATGEWAGPSR